MRRKLVIAEKPSVAQTIANVLGAREKGDGYISSDRWIVSWCVGHLVEPKDADEYDPRYKAWDISTLPILPEKWQYKAVSKTRKQLKVLYGLMARDDVESLVCATDAGREGEAIFRRVYNICRCTKPVERLWVSSLEEQGIRKAFAEMKSDSEYDDLYAAAEARSRADWLVGINASRLYTLKFNDRSVYSVGRVQTPTLRMIAERDKEIESFVAKPLYSVVCDIETAGERWQLSTARVEDKGEAEKALETVRTRHPVITDIEKKEVRKWPQPLYCLNELQRDASRHFGFTADKTLALLQQLYEKKLVTYPRTDSRFITSDMEGTFAGLLSKLRKRFRLDEAGCTFRPAKVCVDDSKVSDHHALLVTETFLSKVASGETFPSDERAILSLIAARMLMAVSTPLVLSETKVKAESGDVVLGSSGNQVTSPGFLAVEKVVLPSVAERRKGFASLPSGISKGEVEPVSIELVEGMTTPPKPYSDDTLLLAMEKAGADEMDKAVERKGIGTSATRAAIIKRLETIGYIERVKGKGKATVLHATDKGRRLLSAVPDRISSPKLTAEWENKLLEVERGRFSARQFEKEIRQYVASFVESEGAGIESRPQRSEGEKVGTCPFCGGDMMFRGKAASCSCGKAKLFSRWKVYGLNTEVVLTKAQIKELLDKGECIVKIHAKRNGKTGEHLVRFSLDGFKDNGWASVSLGVQDR